jgi:hypothetical protein
MCAHVRTLLVRGSTTALANTLARGGSGTCPPRYYAPAVPNFLNLIAALLSRPFPMPHSLPVHSSTFSSPRPLRPVVALQLEQICVDGKILLATTIRPLALLVFGGEVKCNGMAQNHVRVSSAKASFSFLR